MKSAMARVLMQKYPVANLCELFGVKLEDFALKVIKPMGEDARDFCIVVAPFVMRISIHAITFNKDSVPPFITIGHARRTNTNLFSSIRGYDIGREECV